MPRSGSGGFECFRAKPKAFKHLHLLPALPSVLTVGSSEFSSGWWNSFTDPLSPVWVKARPLAGLVVEG